MFHMELSDTADAIRSYCAMRLRGWLTAARALPTVGQGEAGVGVRRDCADAGTTEEGSAVWHGARASFAQRWRCALLEGVSVALR